MTSVDASQDGRMSRSELLIRIRRNRKYADFLKMPPRIKAGDGTYDKFVELFLQINVARDGYITRNELAHYLGVEPKEAHGFEKLKQITRLNAVFKM